LRSSSGLNLAADMREVVVGELSGGRWLLALGGLFPRHGIIVAMARVLRDERAVGFALVGDELVFDPAGIAVAQAPDGILLVASDRALLEQALPASESFRRVGLANQSAGEFATRGPWLRAWWRTTGAETPEWLDQVGQIRLSVRLGKDLELTGALKTNAPQGAAALTSAISAWLAPGSSNRSFVPKADWAGERAILARTKALGSSPNEVMLTSSWRQAELEQGTRSLANQVERWLAGLQE
jgi:hypothetical protein